MAEDDFVLPPDFERELAADLRRYDREQRWAALRMLWGRPIVDVDATRRRRDGVICFECNRGEDWSLGRALLASISLLLDRRHGQRHVDRHRARTGALYIEHFDLGFWDSRADSSGWSFAYLHLYPGCRVEVGTESESSL